MKQHFKNTGSNNNMSGTRGHVHNNNTGHTVGVI